MKIYGLGHLPPIVPPPNWFGNPAKSPKMHEKHAKTHKNTWFLATKGDNVWDQNVKKSENMWFATCGQNLTKRAQKITVFASFFALFHQKSPFWIGAYHLKAIISQSPEGWFEQKRGQKWLFFTVFSETCLGFLSNILPQISQNGCYKIRGFNLTKVHIFVEKTCFFIKNTKFRICILQMHPMNQRLLLMIWTLDIRYP